MSVKEEHVLFQWNNLCNRYGNHFVWLPNGKVNYVTPKKHIVYVGTLTYDTWDYNEWEQKFKNAIEQGKVIDNG